MSVYFYYTLVVLLGALFILVLVEAFRSLGEIEEDAPPQHSDVGTGTADSN
jgi:hypothetical protein